MKLRAYRINNGYTQEEFAKMVGISLRTYCNYEMGKEYPRINIANKICRLLYINITDVDEFKE